MAGRIRRRHQRERGPVVDLFVLLVRTFVAAAIAVGAVVVLILWKAPAGPEGAMLDVVVRVYRPMLWLVLAAALLVVLLPLVVCAFRRLR